MNGIITDIAAMLEIAHLITVADAYARLAGVEEKTVSSRVFADSKKLAAMRGGSDITVGRYNEAIIWFSENWPDGAEWPTGIMRPITNAKTFDACFPDKQPEAAA